MIQVNLLPSEIDGQGTEIGLSFVEQHPDLNTVRNRVRTASGGIEFEYKEYVVSIQKTIIGIAPIVGTTLWNEMRKDNEIAVEKIRKQDDAQQSNEFH